MKAVRDHDIGETTRQFAEATHLSLISIDGDGDIVFVNSSACLLFGYEKEEMLGQPIVMIIPERMRGMHSAGFARAAAGEKLNLGGKTVEVPAVKKDGTEFPIEITLSVWQGREGFHAGAIIKDISERRERETRLLRLASQDTLTGLHNRHQFLSHVSERTLIEAAATVILIDLDGFKEVNDTHGHATGDALLQAVGVRLQYLLAADTVVARLGGDEFAVLLPGGDPLKANAVATEILDAFRRPLHLGGLVLDLGASLGIAITPMHGMDADEVVASADFALYRAKAAGGGCCRMFDHAMRGEAQARRTTRDELRHALRVGDLRLHYQPQVSLATGEVLGFEALIRWHHPEKGVLAPGAFLPALEQSSLALDIGSWTLDEACRMASILNGSGKRYKIGVNLFPTQFRALNFPDKVADAIAAHHLAPECVELEITEDITLADDERSLRTLRRLRELGVRIAFDDFGTGFASLSSLQRFPLTTLKIDRAFVRDIGTPSPDAAITRALIAMSRELGLETIAEGIETPEQEAALIAMGCPVGQGYLYARPMGESNAYSFLESSQTRQRA